MLKILAVMLFIALIFTSAAVTLGQSSGQPAVGVKPGYWVEYSVKTTGSPPAGQDITWARIEIVDVADEEFHANFTVRNADGTLSSNIGSFNFASGNTEAWVIIPANLSPGQSFYDSSINSNVTIQDQLQEIVAGSTRTVTHTNITIEGVVRDKQWDKASGFYIQSVDDITTAAPLSVNNGLAYTVNAKAIATNIWSPQIFGLDQTVFYIMIVVIIVAIALIVALIFLTQKRHANKRALHPRP